MIKFHLEINYLKVQIIYICVIQICISTKFKIFIFLSIDNVNYQIWKSYCSNRYYHNIITYFQIRKLFLRINIKEKK